uniref:Protein rolling stone n=1 Tax=Drosophila pseudoobscura TaxID=7237 RepID=D6QYQ6_9MUSC|nr:hypothetical protein [Drosophila pseudoobscura]
MKLFDDFCKSLNEELQRENFGFAYKRVDLFYRSQWQKGVTNALYLLYRWIWALFFLGVHIMCIIMQFCGGKFFIYMTNWGYGLCTITMLLAAVQVTCWHYDLRNTRSVVQESGNKTETTRGLKIYWWLYNMTITMALSISTVYWVFLHGKMNKPMRFPVTNVITHGLNTVMMLIDFLVVAFPLRLLHVVYSIALAILFFVFTLIYHFCGGTDEHGNPYVYPILDWNNPTSCLVTFAGIFVLIVCYWFLLFGLYKLKRKFNKASSSV